MPKTWQEPSGNYRSNAGCISPSSIRMKPDGDAGFIYFIRILTICFHSSPDNFERVGFKESQSFNDSELIILRNFVNE